MKKIKVRRNVKVPALDPVKPRPPSHRAKRQGGLGIAGGHLGKAPLTEERLRMVQRTLERPMLRDIQTKTRKRRTPLCAGNEIVQTFISGRIGHEEFIDIQGDDSVVIGENGPGKVRDGSGASAHRGNTGYWPVGDADDINLVMKVRKRLIKTVNKYVQVCVAKQRTIIGDPPIEKQCVVSNAGDGGGFGVVEHV